MSHMVTRYNLLAQPKTGTSCYLEFREWLRSISPTQRLRGNRAPRTGQTEIFDLGYPGLALRIGNGGAKSFVLFYRHNGGLVRRTLGRWPQVTLANAREAWRRAREALGDGRDPQAKLNGYLFEHIVEEWLRLDVAARNKELSAYQVRRMVERDLLPAWRGRPITEIGKSDVIALLDTV